MAATATSKRRLATDGISAAKSWPVKMTCSFEKPRREATSRNSSMSKPLNSPLVSVKT
jgi:hypothetical protein